MEKKEQDGEMFTSCRQDEETSAVQDSLLQTTEDFKIMTKQRKSVKCSHNEDFFGWFCSSKYYKCITISLMLSRVSILQVLSPAMQLSWPDPSAPLSTAPTSTS